MTMKDFSLPKKLSSSYVQETQISNFVKIQETTEFIKQLKQCLFNEQLLVDLIMLYCCCVFSIAAENRFQVQKESIREERQRKTSKNNPSILLKEYVLQKHHQFQLSEKLHFKTLQAMYFGIDPESILFQHFFLSYIKNYKHQIQMIEEEEERSLSLVSSECYELKETFIKMKTKINPKFQISPENDLKFQTLKDNVFLKKRNTLDLKGCKTMANLFAKPKPQGSKIMEELLKTNSLTELARQKIEKYSRIINLNNQ